MREVWRGRILTSLGIPKRQFRFRIPTQIQTFLFRFARYCLSRYQDRIWARWRASVEQIETWSMRVLSAATLAEVLAD